MTDARLMEADCIHGIVWYECDECCQLGETRATWQANTWIPDEVNEVQS